MNSNVTTYVASGLTNAVTYYMYVYAYNAAGYSLSSSRVSAIPDVVPGAPPITLVGYGSQYIDISWNTPTNNGSAITKYTVGVSGPTVINTYDVSANVTTYHATSLTNGTTYYLYVSAYNGAGYSAASSRVSAVPYTVPNAPTSVAVSGNSNSFGVTWSTPSNGGSALTKYTIGVSGPVSITYVDVSANLNAYTVTGVNNGTTYYVSMTATNAAGTSAVSSPVVSVTPNLTYTITQGTWYKAPNLAGSNPYDGLADWLTCSVSASGQYQLAVNYTYGLFKTSNYGTTWTAISTSSTPTLSSIGLTPTSTYTSCAVSGTGQYQAIGFQNANGIYYSTNYGANWTKSNAPTSNSFNWWYIAISPNGVNQISINSNNSGLSTIYYSSNYGVSWSPGKNTSNSNFTATSFAQNNSCAISNSNICIAVSSTLFCISSDNGQTWSSGSMSAGMYCCAISYSGTVMSYTTQNSKIYYYNGSGVATVSSNWTQAASGANYAGIAMTDNGQIQICSTRGSPSGNGGLYYSTNYGHSWSLAPVNSTITSSTSTPYWVSSAMSHDGAYQLAVIQSFGSNPGVGMAVSTVVQS